MSVPTGSTAARTRPGSGQGGAGALVAVYALLAVVGLIGTWWFNLSYRPGPGDPSYLGAWFANPASSSVAVDVLVTAVAASIFYVVEGRRAGVRLAWLLVPLTVIVALAFTFPLFLALRERALARTAPRHPAPLGQEPS